MEIKDGYNHNVLKIRIGNPNGRMAEFWVEFKEEGLPKETLSYITLEELLDLKDEIDKAIQEITKTSKEEGE